MARGFFIVVAALSACAAVCSAGFAFTSLIIDQMTIKDYQCFKDLGYDWNSTVVQCMYCKTDIFYSNPQPTIDPNCSQRIASAYAAGLDRVDVYMTPCVADCKTSATDQIQQLYGYLKTYNVKFRKMWVSLTYVHWMSIKLDNRNFLREILDASEKYFGDQFGGLETSEDDWSNHIGVWNGPSKYPLWWDHEDDLPSWANFETFGGWKQPVMKEFKWVEKTCGFDRVPLNYFEEDM